MEPDLEHRLNELESVRRRAGRRTLVMLFVVTLVASGLAITYVLRTYQRAESAQQEVQVVTKEKEQETRTLTKKLEDSQEALETEKKALPPVDPEKAGIKEYHLGRYNDAVKSYDEALKKDPNNAYIWNLKGYSLFKAGRYEESLNALRKSVQVDPQYAWGYFDLARVYCKVKQHENAVAAARTAVKLWPGIQGKMSNDKEFKMLCGDPSDLLANKAPEGTPKP